MGIVGYTIGGYSRVGPGLLDQGYGPGTTAKAGPAGRSRGVNAHSSLLLVSCLNSVPPISLTQLEPQGEKALLMQSHRLDGSVQSMEQNRYGGSNSITGPASINLDVLICRMGMLAVKDVTLPSHCKY